MGTLWASEVLGGYELPATLRPLVCALLVAGWCFVGTKC
jgi:hypothetical protein